MPGPERELKFVLDDRRTAGFLEAAAREMVYEFHGSPFAYTRTTYLDTDDLSLLRAPGAIRRRLRVREYAAAASLDAPALLTGVSYLELKESAAGRRNKARVPLRPAMMARLLAGEPLRAPFEILARRSGSQIGTLLTERRMRPRMTTWYRRTSLVAAGVRATLDHGVAFTTPEFSSELGVDAAPSGVFATWPPTVLEIKVVGALPEWLAGELDGITESVGLSKFEFGMQALDAAARPLSVAAG